MTATPFPRAAARCGLRPGRLALQHSVRRCYNLTLRQVRELNLTWFLASTPLAREVLVEEINRLIATKAAGRKGRAA